MWFDSFHLVLGFLETYDHAISSNEADAIRIERLKNVIREIVSDLPPHFLTCVLLLLLQIVYVHQNLCFRYHSIELKKFPPKR